MGGVDSLNAHVSVYRIDVRGKKWYWPHDINTIDALKNAALKVFKLVNADDKMDFLAFTRRITTSSCHPTLYNQEKDRGKEMQLFQLIRGHKANIL